MQAHAPTARCAYLLPLKAASCRSERPTLISHISPEAAYISGCRSLSGTMVNQQHKDRAPLRRSRLGCLACRKRKKKCDSKKPKCDSCVKVGTECVFPNPIKLCQPDQFLQSSVKKRKCVVKAPSPQPVELPRPMDMWTLTEPLYRTAGMFINSDQHPTALLTAERASHFLQYYQYQLAPKVCVCSSQNNSLLKVFLPLALESQMLMKALIAWAALFDENTSKCHPEAGEIGRNLKWDLTKQVLKEWDTIKSSSAASLSKYCLIASFLVLTSIEVLIEGNGKWPLYISMAHHLISHDDLFRTMVESETGTFLLQNFLYHDLTHSLVNLRGPKLSTTEIKLVVDAKSGPDSYMGICRPLFEIYAQTSQLTKLVSETNNHDLLLQAIHEGNQLEITLENTVPHEHDLSSITNEQDLQHHLNIFNFYKDVGFIYIRQCVYHLHPLSLRSLLLVNKVLPQVSNILGSPTQGMMLFPMFILSVDVVSPEMRQWTLDKLRKLYAEMKMNNIAKAIDLLKCVWDRNCQGQKYVFWPDLAEENGWNITFA